MRADPAPFDPAVVMPVYNHAVQALKMISRIRAQGLPCIVVDDGSDGDNAVLLSALASDPGVWLMRLPRNLGKGAAVMAGMRAAASRGHSHVVQIDADGQHDPDDIGAFVDAARVHPDAVICGVPRYDASVPTARRVGRYITHFWVWVHTLSMSITDSMCGFRLYPLGATLAQLDERRPGPRMDFDTEMLVLLYWRGVPILNRPTPVSYPPGGISHFRMWRDNWRISCMHARLFFGMLRRAPTLLARKVSAR